MGNGELSLFSFQKSNQKQQPYQISNLDRRPTFNPQKQSFIRIASCSQKQSDSILQNISCYQKNKCQSLPRLKEYYHAKNNKFNVYCSNQEFFYIVFQGCTCCNLKEQFNFRRLNGKSFNQQEIKNIIQTFLCAVRQYFQVFGRDLDKIQLQDISFNSRGRLYMKDPWLRKLREAISVNQINILLQYPSPERLQSLIQLQQNYYNPFLSILFSIGVIGLQLTQMNFVDDLYLNYPKKFNFDKMKQLLRALPSSQLKNGLQILLSVYPENRSNIYNLWGTFCKRQKYLQKIESKNHEELLSQNTNKINKQIPHYDSFLPKNQAIIKYRQPANVYSSSTNYRQNQMNLNNNNPSNSQQSNLYPIRLEQSAVTKQIELIRQRPNFQKILYNRNIQQSHKSASNRTYSLNPQERFHIPNKINNIPTLIVSTQNHNRYKYQANKIEQQKINDISQKNNKVSYDLQQKHQFYTSNNNSFSNDINKRNIFTYRTINPTRDINFIQPNQYSNCKLQQTSKTIPYAYRFKQNMEQTIDLKKKSELENISRQKHLTIYKN